MNPAPKTTPFESDPAKIAGCRSFWRREVVRRPLEGNHDALWPPMGEMAGHLRKIQCGAMPRMIRGSFEPGEMRLLMDSLDPRGLFLNTMVRDRKEIEALRHLVGMAPGRPQP